ncbi:hypothetical protein [Alkalinema sp. FACHB-956]|uniref:hypothetical protein n=1 Tax=Alkalinema sp. FACHB-956 TaxID=2692768 RepID=UPI001684990E|nr:hypothetical protein [Alkalinema sp. FACHB-956]MBD2328637.1 hypothetical protein [Alkalinema sp. FACHB-956]
MVRLSDVFVAGGFPSITYISRDEYQLESTVEDYLDARYKLLSISGSTKSGKTVLVRKIVPKQSSFWIPGGQVSDLNSFWGIVLEKTGGYTSLSETTNENTNTVSGREMTASIKPGGMGGDIKSQFNESEQYGVSQTVSRTVPSASSAINQLLDHKIPLVVDDFHYIDKPIQQSIVRSLKDPIFEGLPVILITVPHRAFDVIRVEKEMTGRVKQLQIPAWQASELEKIAELGFRALNVHCNPELVRKMAEESFDSPHLMQDFCAALCKANGVRESQSSLIELQEPDDWQSFFRNMASDTSKLAFERLAIGPRQRTDRIRRTLVNGETCDIYGAVLFAIASTGPKIRLSYEDIRTGLRTVLSDEIPQAHEVTRILEKMSEIAKDEIEGEPVVDWDSSYLHISDPFFAYYLRWGVVLPEAEQRSLF